jgi:hypothetical protein
MDFQIQKVVDVSNNQVVDISNNQVVYISNKECIPYVLIFTYPDYKQAHTKQYFGYGTYDKIKEEIETKLYKYVWQSIKAWYGTKNITVETIKKLYDGYEIPYNMMQKSWIIKVLINKKWKNMNFTFQEIFDMLVKNNKINKEEEDNDYDEDDYDEDDKQEEDNNKQDDDKLNYDDEKLYINQSEAVALKLGPTNNLSPIYIKKNDNN